jgi:hypothetical protein
MIGVARRSLIPLSVPLAQGLSRASMMKRSLTRCTADRGGD